MNISIKQLETAPQLCPMCEGELYVTRSEPRAGASCPFCREPLWFLQKAADEMVILTFLCDGKHKNSASGWNDAKFWSLRNATRVVVDLSRLPIVSGVFLDILAALQQKLKSAGGSLKLCGLNLSVAETLNNYKKDMPFEIFPDEETALESFDQPGDADSMILPMLSEPVHFSESGKMIAHA